MRKLKLSRNWKIALVVIAIVAVLAIAGGATIAKEYMADNPAACGKCHVMQPYVRSYYDSNFLDNVHAGNTPETKCAGCHRRTIVQETREVLAFILGNYSVSEKDVRTQSSCKSCHQLEQIVAAVRNRPDFVADPQLSYHLNAEKARACRDPRAEIVQCQDCHKSHRTGVNYCTTCHSSTFGSPRI